MTTQPELVNGQPEKDNGLSNPVSNVATSVDTNEIQAAVQPDGRNIDDISLAEMLQLFLGAPVNTFKTFLQIINTPTHKPVGRMAIPYTSAGVGRFLPDSTWWGTRQKSDEMLTPEQAAVRQREGVQLGLRLAAMALSLYGSGILATQRFVFTGLDVGAPYLLMAFLVWLGAEIYGAWPSLRHWRSTEDDRTLSVSSDYDNDTVPAFGSENRSITATISLLSAALVTSVAASLLNTGNQFTLLGVAAWVGSIILWVVAFAPPNWSFAAALSSIRQVRFYRNWTFLALLLILIFAAYFRLNQLDTVPPEMTSDHVEKLLDAQRIVNGNRQIFFPNNGGREPIQFYTLAFINQLLGLPLSFLTLKVLSVVEGLLSIVILWWMGREIVGVEDRKFGNLVGVLLAALVAVSYWHTALSRLGLRIILTVVFTGLMIIFLSRALRYNRRGDFIKAGLVLGFGLYAYQAVRMLPVVVLVGIGLVIAFRAIGTRLGQRGDWKAGQYLQNLIVLVVISIVVFVPLFTFSLQYPNDFWRRTSGRLLGDDLIQTTDESGRLVQRNATFEERLDAFEKNWPILQDNIRNALLMYNWKGDVAWINAAPNRPTMDMFTASLLVVGLAAWLARMIRRRDVVDWLMPLMLFIMLLPSALSIAYPMENPSATRTSGTLPEAYLFAALPLGLVCTQIMRFAPRRGIVFAAGLTAIFLIGAYNANQNIYFGEYKQYYTGASLPYTDAGKVLKGFAESGGGYGNAFMVAYPYWWDHRAIGIEAGLMDWPNGIVSSDELPRFLYLSSNKTDQYRLEPNKDLLFFYSMKDETTEGRLMEWFPEGYSMVFESYQPEDNFKLFRVPALGENGLIDFFVATEAVAG